MNSKDSILQLAGRLVHEINTPVTILQSNLQMLQESLLPSCKEEVSQEIDAIKKQIERLRQLAVSFSSIDTQEFTKTKADLNSSLQKGIELTEQRYGKKAADFCLHIRKSSSDLDVTVFGDDQKLQLVWLTLFSNAIDAYMQHHIQPRRIETTVYKTNKTLLLKITDYAGGIDKNALANMFKPLNSSKTHKGLGLNMFICKNILNRHGFGISIKTSPSGTAFIIDLQNTNITKGD